MLALDGDKRQVTGVASNMGHLLGTGILTLSGTNSYVGGTTLTAGTIAAGAVGALGTGGISFSTGTTLDSPAGTGGFFSRLKDRFSDL